MSFIETQVTSAGPMDDSLLGFSVDSPGSGKRIGGHTVEIEGWVLARDLPAVAVEIWHEGEVLQRTPLQTRRPDIALAFPDVPYAARSGFRTLLRLHGTSALEVELRAVLSHQRRVPLGRIHALRKWREDSAPGQLVSIIIPSFNHAHFLRDSIESVLAQTYPHFEVVVVDDGSTDNTEQVAAAYPGVRFTRQPNAGLSAARNTGLRRSSGSFIVFLDADDRLLPEALAIGMEQLQQHAESPVVAGKCRFIDLEGNLIGSQEPLPAGADVFLGLLRGSPLLVPAVMYRRSLFDFVLPFDSRLEGAEDYDLYYRVAREFPIWYHAREVAEVRRHGSNMTTDSRRMLRANLAVLRRQRRNLRRGSSEWAAYGEGIRYWKGIYGPRLVGDAYDHISRSQWLDALADVKVLLRNYPKGIFGIVHHAQ